MVARMKTKVKLFKALFVKVMKIVLSGDVVMKMKKMVFVFVDGVLMLKK